MSEYVLEVYEGVGQVRRVPIEDGATLSVGRTQDCDVVLKGTGISRLHCEVSRSGAVVRMSNRSTTKAGTRVGGKKVEETALTSGDEITVGDMVMVFQAPAEKNEKSTAEDAEGAEKSAEKKKKKKDSAREEKQDSAREEKKDSAREKKKDSARATPTAGESREGSEDEQSEEERGAAGAVQEFLERKEMERKFRLAVGLVSLAILSGIGAWAAIKVYRASQAPPEQAKQTRRTERGEDRPRERGAARPQTAGTADKAWHDLRFLEPTAITASLETFAEQYPDDPRADDAVFYAKQLRQAQRSAGAQGTSAVVEAMFAEAVGLKKLREPARASEIFKLVAALSPGTPLARKARQEQRELRKIAEEAFDELSGKARALAARLGPVQAIVAVVEAAPKLRGLGKDDDIDALVAALEREAIQQVRAGTRSRVQRSGHAFTVEQEATNAALRMDLPKAWAKAQELLLLSLGEEDRLRAHWLRHQIQGIDRLFKAMLAAAKGPKADRPTLTMRGNLKLRLVSADARRAVLEPVVEKGSGELKQAWTRLAPFQVQELFAKLGGRDYLLAQARAFHAFKTGLDDQGVKILYPWANLRRYRGLVFSFYSLTTGVPLPEGGFVLFEGRFVNPKKRDEILAQRKAARAAAKELAAKAREERSRKKLLLLLQKVLALMDQGHYAAGRHALARLAKRHADVPGVGDVALKRFNSPVLRRRDVRLSKNLGRNGPSSNRMDIYFMGDGFVFDDKKQVHFDRFADSAVKFCQLQDFFKEYDQFINYWAVNLESKEEGLTKDGQRKDTALGTEINGGVHTVADRARVFRILQEHFPREHDRIAVCVGNEFANVATGGGGTVAVCKTMLEATPHELGHAIGGLGDEYDQEPGPNPKPGTPYTGPARAVRINVVAGARKSELPAVAGWKAWLDPRGDKNWTGKPIDFFEGANRQRRGYWRPQKSCVMRDIGSGFCAVCMEVMVLRLYDYVRPIDQSWPDKQEITAGREAITLRVLVLKPKTHPLFVHWRRKILSLGSAPEPEGDDDDDGEGTRERKRKLKLPKGKKRVKNISGMLKVYPGEKYVHHIKIRPRELDPGRYEFSAEVWDPTKWIRDVHRKKLTQTRKWIVTVPPR